MERTKRRRLSSRSGPKRNQIANESAFPSDPLVLAADSDRGTWNGFCEIESEPALFNVMLREFGVKGIKVQEVVSLDEGMMALLPKPVYGLIFLFRWREDDPGKQEASCPDGIWFANQTTSNACASVALLNIVNNIEGIELGENLRNFKDFTTSFTPALRGDAIANFEFIKRIHNSFARTMDMLNSDLQLRNEAMTRKSLSAKRQQDDNTSEAGFHFIAFMPAMGRVWKFDGLERQPQGLGPCSGGDWLELVKPEILARMTEYEEDQIEFSILGLVRDPIIDCIGELALNVKRLRKLNERLGDIQDVTSTATQPITHHDDIILGPAPAFGLTQEDIDLAKIPDEQDEQYQMCSLEELALEQQSLRASQQAIKASIQEELQSRQRDDDYAAGRRHDYSSAVYSWARILARKGVIRDLISESQ
ncbi:hypothetical protein VTN77DRAFT_9178 [Rasamsonia byssochlamydoides]|uniref:uncharacterized protein n=1 Tax=Rasamsonia byssochlamydoides TaxID=89139 RepID=UPI003743549D